MIRAILPRNNYNDYSCIFKSYLSIISPRYGNNFIPIIFIVKIMMQFLNTHFKKFNKE